MSPTGDHSCAATNGGLLTRGREDVQFAKLEALGRCVQFDPAQVTICIEDTLGPAALLVARLRPLRSR